MEEFKKTWFQRVWAGLTICTLTLGWIIRKVDAAWAQSRALAVLNDVLGWIVLALTVVLFVLHCVENWQKGKRYFWRKCRRWGGSIFLGTLMAAVLVVMIRLYKAGGVLAMVLPDKEYRLFLFVLFSLGGLLYMIARYKYNHPNKD
ncbi:MAG: hypothetical protein IIU61_06740 [Alistipes sp.]|nr:hypothetical protein [Alistipes sp.]MBQ5359124.1 hypothetical protein [Alistipes sp.]